MGFRFQKRIKLLPGLRVNLSKTGISWSIGTRGAGINLRGGKVTGNVGIPGTGLSYRQRLDDPQEESAQPTAPSEGGGVLRLVDLVLVISALALWVVAR